MFMCACENNVGAIVLFAADTHLHISHFIYFKLHTFVFTMKQIQPINEIAFKLNRQFHF